jgi:hypothetical protein
MVNMLHNIKDLQNFTATYGQQTRDSLEQWTNTTFLGTADEQEYTVL